MKKFIILFVLLGAACAQAFAENVKVKVDVALKNDCNGGILSSAASGFDIRPRGLTKGETYVQRNFSVPVKGTILVRNMWMEGKDAYDKYIKIPSVPAGHHVYASVSFKNQGALNFCYPSEPVLTIVKD